MLLIKLINYKMKNLETDKIVKRETIFVLLLFVHSISLSKVANNKILVFIHKYKYFFIMALQAYEEQNKMLNYQRTKESHFIGEIWIIVLTYFMLI